VIGPVAFLRRDLRIQLSYRFSLALHLLGVVAHALTFYFIGRLSAGSPWMGPYGEYFPFVLIGLAFSGFLGFGLSGFSSVLRVEQYYGTLESLLASPLPAWRVALLATLSGHLMTLVEAALYLLAGWALLGVDFSRASWLPAGLALALSVSSFSCLGILAGSFILVFKRGDPVHWLLGTLSQFLGGVYFPVGVLPGWLQKAAACLPVTHGLEALRATLLRGAPLTEIREPLLVLLAFNLVGWPLSFAAFRTALRAALRRGTLGHC